VLAERVRSEGAHSTRAVKANLGTPKGGVRERSVWFDTFREIIKGDRLNYTGTIPWGVATG